MSWLLLGILIGYIIGDIYFKCNEEQITKCLKKVVDRIQSFFDKKEKIKK